ncbi:uncharacterized protein LOC121736604 [Aricia agestis]|uniref:uncharacterized protein LOC121736604 n=1 Tax=Aricia agestis TaxID=91739 RepID=UPI001C2017C4|nr:uncharacterized protein LOC121736604 [Aricia agestis]
MARQFSYDIIQLIEGVRDRPGIWDKTCEEYKDKAEKRAAWVAVFRLLDESYDRLDKEEQRLLGERIITKWTNIRDTFVKSLKTRAGKPKRKYVLHKHLKFLLKGTPHENETEDDTEQTAEDSYAPRYIKTEESESSEDESPNKRRKESSEDDSYQKKWKKESRQKTIVEPEISAIDVYNDPRVMNEDEAFFASLLPSVVNYSEDERLEFRLEVLALMKRIKEKRSDPFY